MDANWDRFLKYRLDPAFFSTDCGIIVNVRKWNSLSEKTRDILTGVAIEHEISSVKALQELRKNEFAELDRRGIKGVALSAPAGARFVEEARKASWARMEERMEKAGGRAEAEKIKKLFAPG
jgi:TRAP-type C4-dicarboxylate transport system substrate-binding protein